MTLYEITEQEAQQITGKPYGVHGSVFNPVLYGEKWVVSELESPYVTVIGTIKVPKSNAELLEGRKKLGQEIINEFLESRIANSASIEEDVQLLQIFAPIESALRLGSLRMASALISAIEPMEAFTAETKQYFINKIENHLLDENA